jgi:hypothetical protein
MRFKYDEESGDLQEYDSMILEAAKQAVLHNLEEWHQGYEKAVAVTLLLELMLQVRLNNVVIACWLLAYCTSCVSLPFDIPVSYYYHQR